MQKALKDRFKATGIHLTLSMAVFSIFLFVVFYWWYPAPFFESNGGWPVMRMLIFVDLCLGPLCTFVIYKEGKPGLKFDISVILLVQIGALVYGTNVLYTEKPFVLVHVIDRFNVMAKVDVDVSKISNVNLVKPNVNGPNIVVARLPEDPVANAEISERILFGAPDLEFHPELYQDYQLNLSYLLENARDNSFYLSRSDEHRVQIQAALDKNNVDITTVFFYPLVGKKNDILLMLNRKDGSIISGVSVDPW